MRFLGVALALALTACAGSLQEPEVEKLTVRLERVETYIRNPNCSVDLEHCSDLQQFQKRPCLLEGGLTVCDPDPRLELRPWAKPRAQ